MVRILRRLRPRHAGHTLASSKDPLPMKPAVPTCLCASSEWKRWGNDSVELRFHGFVEINARIMTLGILFLDLLFHSYDHRSQETTGIYRKFCKTSSDSDLLRLLYSMRGGLKPMMNPGLFLYLSIKEYWTQCYIAKTFGSPGLVRPTCSPADPWIILWWFEACRVVGDIWNTSSFNGSPRLCFPNGQAISK